MTRKARFGKTDWIALGFRQLIKDGPAGLTIEALCRVAQRTRGSFYHHFTDHDSFLTSLALTWKKQNTLDVAEEIMSNKVEKQREALADLATHLDQNLERAIRQFAQVNKTTRTVVREVDQIRTNFVQKLYEERGLEPDLAREISQIEYAAFVGAQIVWPEMTAKEHLALDRRFALLIKNMIGTDEG